MIETRALSMAAAVVASAILAACGTWGFGGVSAPDERLTLQASLAGEPVVHAGQAVIVDVTLTNVSRRTLEVPALDAQSVAFYVGPAATLDRVQRYPVVSRAEPLGRRVELPPEGTVHRTFVLTRAAEFKGPVVLQAHYDPRLLGGGEGLTKVYSNVVEFRVDDTVLFTRDADGLILREDAIRLAMAAAGAPVRNPAARLIEDAREGLLLWQVNLDVDDPGADPARVSYLVDPYVGRVLPVRVTPFDPAELRDDRVIIRTRQPGDAPTTATTPGRRRP